VEVGEKVKVEVAEKVKVERVKVKVENYGKK